MGKIGQSPTIEQQVAGALMAQCSGWLIQAGAALAYKFYPTAIGPKKALAYLEDGGLSSDDFVLKGDYQSEGRNVLEAHAVLIPKTADTGMVAQLVAQFAADADATIAETYAMKLVKPQGPSPGM